jgi:hypothetical protein
MMGMSADGNTIFRAELDNVISQQVWPNMDDFIGRWTVMLTAKDTMGSAASHSAVKVHVATNHAQRRKPIHKNTKCINCGKPRDMYAQCDEALSKCSQCSGSHHTSIHGDVQNLRRARGERLGTNKQKTPDVNSPKERISRLAKNAKAEREPDFDEYDAQLDAMIAVEESMNGEDNEQSTFIGEGGYGAKIFIGGEMLEDDNIICRLAKLDTEATKKSFWIIGDESSQDHG